MGIQLDFSGKHAPKITNRYNRIFAGFSALEMHLCIFLHLRERMIWSPIAAKRCQTKFLYNLMQNSFEAGDFRDPQLPDWPGLASFLTEKEYACRRFRRYRLWPNWLRDNSGTRETCYHFCYQSYDLINLSTLL